MRTEKDTDLRSALILAGIDEINKHGASEFSVRRVASACHVSTAAPYKHFKDKKELIRAIIDYVNKQWLTEQDLVLSKCDSDPRTQLIEVSVAYLKFLMEKNYYRQILMLKNADFDNLYHPQNGESNSRTQQIMIAVKEAYGFSDEVWERKKMLVRSLLFGSVFLFTSGEFPYNEDTMQNVRYMISREFDLQ